jgi:CheY-like chemotaxis protein
MVQADEVDVAQYPGAAIRALIAEDDIIIRMDVAESLRHQGWEVVETGTADDAISVLERDPNFQVLLTDVHMPGANNGIDLAKHVKERHPHIKIAVMSGQHLPSAAERQLYDLFLSKPFNDLLRDLLPLMSREHD